MTQGRDVFTKKTNRRRVPIKERFKSLGKAVKAGVRYIVPLIVLAIVAVGVPVAVFFGYRHVVSTPYFSLDDVQVRGLQNLSEAEVLTHAGVRRGANAFDIEPKRVELQLETMPWIRDARVTKRLPRTLEIEIDERVAAAVLVDGGTYTLIDDRGEPFKQIDDADRVDDLLELPLISGLSRSEAKAGNGQELVLEALDVVRIAREQQLPELSEIHIDPVMGLSIVPTDSGIEIRLGRGKYKQRLERLRSVFAALEQEAREVDYILLDSEENLNRVTVGNHATERKGTDE